MVRLIALREIKNLFREKTFWVLTGAMIILMATSVIIAAINQQTLNKQRSEAQAISRQGWLDQSPKNPHSAAHFGNFAFRLPTPLSVFDNGLNTYTGSQVFLEPHKQDDFKFSAAEDADSLLRFGELTPAFVLQTILPLLIIFLCFNTVSREKEDNTLKMLLGNGISMRQLVTGKIIGNWLMLSLLLTALFIPLAFFLPHGDNIVETILALVLVWLAYLSYAFIVISICIVVSAFSKSSRSSIIRLLCMWMLACIIVPKLCSNLGSTLYKTPSQFEYANHVAHDEEEGLDGHDPNDKRREVLLKATLVKYNVDTVTKLPVNFDAIAMVESEKYTTQVFRKRIGEVRELFTKQNSIGLYASFINPFQATQYSSMALAGTDYPHFTNFQDSAEAYRLYFVNTMNDFMASHTKSGDWSTKFGQETYQLIKPFNYTPPAVSKSFMLQPLPFIAMLFWLVASVALIQSTNHIKIVS